MLCLDLGVLKVLGDRPGADLKRVRYGTVREAQGDEFEDLKFAAGQVGRLPAETVRVCRARWRPSARARSYGSRREQRAGPGARAMAVRAQ